MSPLERVIEEQQREIDRLRELQTYNIEQWDREHKMRERVVMAAFNVLSYPESPECHFELKRAIMAWGYCPSCECSPCQCDEDGDS